MADDEISILFPTELREMGVLQEINRLILHPLGLALEVTEDQSRLRIWDCRSDLAGVMFDKDTLDPEKAANVANLLEERGGYRIAELDFVIQPLPPETKQLHLTVKEQIVSRIPGPGEVDEGEEQRFAGLAGVTET
jgi:hypothetical protein